MVSSDQVRPAPPSLPMEADPSGFTERAPDLASLLPDTALSLALSRGDALAVHAALSARFEREPKGPARDTLQRLLARPELFAVSERPPRLGGALGTGFAFVGLPPVEKQEAPFVATRALRILGVPIWPLSQHLVRRGRDGQFEVLGRVPSSLGLARGVAVLATVGLVTTGLVVGLLPAALHEVSLANGLSRPVQVSLNGRPITLEPGVVMKERIFSLEATHQLEARWPGEPKPFETRSIQSGTRAVYNVLGAAPLQVDDASDSAAPRRLPGTIASLAPHEELVADRGGWELLVREYAEAGNWQQAAELAQDVAIADPTALRAREEALRWSLPYGWDRAETFTQELTERYPDDLTVHHLAQDVAFALGHEETSREHYAQWAAQAPDSLFRALLHVRSRPPKEHMEAYWVLRNRFTESPEPQRALARLHLDDGDAEHALELLDFAQAKAPESSLEDLEFRVRTLVSLNRMRDASNAVRQYASEPRNRTWELAVLAGRLDRLTGPTRSQYVTRDLIPPQVARSHEHMLVFSLLTGESTVKDEELKAVADPELREALEITRALLTDLEKATTRARDTSDAVLHRLPLEAATVLALEFAHTGDTRSARRVYRSHLALWLARDPLETYVLTGVRKPRFALLPPTLVAAAHLIRAHELEDEKSQGAEQALAGKKDLLGGFARRALDPGYKEYVPRRLPLNWRRWHERQITIIKGPPPP
ncbi:hypothetical protein [Hyalangium rubrum]|uniref:Tetratricopeptide repeat protein n=1 Tax=Hyalangium rubrum TaxID=3103134 RepID=A0ABU5H402_9BACT|nr:hypothetical protein [Hyalangium sp. s54d21]MDY7228200.1 hypothetical protein [Hyalangium sp. s54d21]